MKTLLRSLLLTLLIVISFNYSSYAYRVVAGLVKADHGCYTIHISLLDDNGHIIAEGTVNVGDCRKVIGQIEYNGEFFNSEDGLLEQIKNAEIYSLYEVERDEIIGTSYRIAGNILDNNGIIVMIFPNPNISDPYVYLNSEICKGICDITFINMQGQTVKKIRSISSNGSIKLGIEDLCTGLYNVTIKSQYGTIQQTKFIKL